MPTSEGHYTSKCASPVNDTPELVILVPFLALCPSPCLLWMTTIAGDDGANLYTNPSAQLLLPAIAFLTLSSLDSPATWHTPPPTTPTTLRRRPARRRRRSPGLLIRLITTTCRRRCRRPGPISLRSTNGAAYFAPADHAPRDEVRTLFIAGLPDDVKPREVYNLFREFPGYQSAQLRRSGQSSQVRIFFSFPPIVLLTYLVIVSRGIRIYCFYRPTVSTFCNACSKSDDGVSYCYDKRVRGSVAYSRGFSDSGNDNHSLHV
ncbi:hypothetical protein B296_00001566 [Ensete ventricosum]|uniref:RRM domain-containing protein n=1 Tax=Ensete ventricosum TaxID=4639 RepID=A0A427BAG7_ENSVE|nr:hypothetical protein B296_00001566 [Ensete ventricosum]